MNRLVALMAVVVTAASANTRAETPSASRQQTQARYEITAVRFATLPAFAVRGLIAGADPARRLDIPVMVHVIRGVPGRTILFDAGFYREKFMTQWKPADYVQPSAAVAELGIKPEDVTDIIVSHIHWDHADGVDLFPRARVWIQREEYEYHIGDQGQPLRGAADRDVAAMFARLKGEGRVVLVDGDAKELFPGVTVYTGGKHTYASQYAVVQTGRGPVLLASDNLYLYENLDRRVPIAQTLDAQANVAAQGRMLQLATDPRLIVPGHDPAVFTRFPKPGGRLARIE